MFPFIGTISIAGRALEIQSYHALVLVGVAAGVALLMRQSGQVRVSRRVSAALLMWSILGGLIGARALVVAVNLDQYYFACVDPAYYNATFHPPVALAASACWETLQPWKGGMVYLGGLAGGAVAAVLFARRRGLRFADLGDLLAPGVVLAHAAGRVGCLLAGCCWGAPSGLPWAVRYPAGSLPHYFQASAGLIDPSALESLPTHPVPIYEAVANLAILALLLVLAAQRRRGGTVVGAYLVAYSVTRFFVEVFRGDEARGAVLRWTIPAISRALGLSATTPLLLSTSQLISLVMMTAGVLVLVTRRNGLAQAGPAICAPPSEQR